MQLPFSRVGANSRLHGSRRYVFALCVFAPVGKTFAFFALVQTGASR